ncbi:hypothetical protein KY316_02660 [Candidatus Woesearchaeota archaeon]|nr:hypothetical protein [Candidatus Woesearchaeota archaeon]
MKTNHLKRSAILLAASFALGIVFVVLHNVLSGLINVEEPVFFVLAIIAIALLIPASIIYFIVSLIMWFLKKGL